MSNSEKAVSIFWMLQRKTISKKQAKKSLQALGFTIRK